METATATRHLTIEPDPRHLRVRHMGQVIADSKAVLTLTEGSLPPVYYFPRGDVQMARLQRTNHHTHCPFKGDATYFSLDEVMNAVWSYEHPLDQARAIKDYLAFYADKVTIEVVAR